MLLLVNELRQNGAEFISINEQRLTNLSGITLAGNQWISITRLRQPMKFMS